MKDIDKYLYNELKRSEVDIPNEIEKEINYTLNKINTNKKYKFKVLRPSLATIMLLVTIIPSSYALSKSIVYFESKNVAYRNTIADKPISELYDEHNNIKLMIEELSIDGNFIDINYTIENKNGIKDKVILNPINNKIIGFENDNKPILYVEFNDKKNSEISSLNIDAYLESKNMVRLKQRINLIDTDTKDVYQDNLKIKITAYDLFETEGEWTINLTDIVPEDLKLVNIDEKIILNKFKNDNLKVDKLTISPYGNQMVVYQTESNLNGYGTAYQFSLRDDKGKNIQILNESLSNDLIEGYYKNIFEITRFEEDTKYIELIPYKINEIVEFSTEKFDIEDNKSIKISDTSSLNIKSININDKEIKIDYYSESMILPSVEFDFYDKYNKKIGLDNSDVEIIDRENGIYRYTASTLHTKGLKKMSISGFDYIIEAYDSQALKIHINQ